MALSEHVHEMEMWLMEGRALSARWVSCQLGIPAATATALLDEYKRSHGDVRASYVVSGQGSDGRYSINVCADDQLEATKSKFARVSSSQIYSVQKAAGENVFNEIHTANYRQAKEMLSTPGAADQFMRNEFGAVRYSQLQVSHDKKAVPTKAPRPVAAVAPAAAKDPAKAAAPARSAAVTPSAGSGIKEEVIKSAAVKNFFKSGGSAPAAAKPAASTPRDSSPKKKVAKKDENVNDDGEWDDGTSYETDKGNLRKRKPSGPVFEEREEAPPDSCVEMDVALEGDAEEPASQETKGPNKFRVFGAMDTFIEDAAIAEHKREVAAGGAGDPPSGRPGKRRKLVEKVFCDEKGYLVTEMVYEDCADDDPEALQPVSEPAKKAPPSLPKPAAKPAGKSKEPAKGQKSMMSFFGGKK